jgi:hypothetical protein
MSRAVSTGENPYQPVRVLAQKYLGVSVSADWRNDPSAHPPTMLALAYPMAYLSYPAAAKLWWLLELLCLTFAIVVAVRSAGFEPSMFNMILLVGLIVGLPPFYVELYHGQVVIMMLLAVSLSWFAASKNRMWTSGILLGISILLKLFPWPFLVAAAFSKNWRFLIGALIVIVCGYGLVFLLFGQDVVETYFLVVAPALERDQGRYEPTNFSLSALAWRFFAGTHTWGEAAISAPPAISLPKMGFVTSVVLQTLTLAVVLWLMRKQTRFVNWFGVMCCVSLLVSPIVRDHYMVLLLIPAAGIAHKFRQKKLPLGFQLGAIVSSLILIIPHNYWLAIARFLGGAPIRSTEALTLSFPAAFVTVFFPVLALLNFLYISCSIHQERMDTGPMEGSSRKLPQ